MCCLCWQLQELFLSCFSLDSRPLFNFLYILLNILLASLESSQMKFVNRFIQSFLNNHFNVIYWKCSNCYHITDNTVNLEEITHFFLLAHHFLYALSIWHDVASKLYIHSIYCLSPATSAQAFCGVTRIALWYFSMMLCCCIPSECYYKTEN